MDSLNSWPQFSIDKIDTDESDAYFLSTSFGSFIAFPKRLLRAFIHVLRS